MIVPGKMTIYYLTKPGLPLTLTLRRKRIMETKNRIIEFKATEGNHIYLEGDKIVANGVTYYVTAHYFRWNDGKFYLGREDQRPYERGSSLYISRQGNPMAKISTSARRKIAEMLPKAVNEWAESNKDSISQAEKKYLEYAISTREKAISEMQSKIDEMTKEIRQLKNGWHLTTYSDFAT